MSDFTPVDQHRIHELRRAYRASFGNEDLYRLPYSDASDQLAALHDACWDFVETISNLRAQARTEITRLGVEFDYEDLAKRIKRLAAFASRAGEEAEKKRQQTSRGRRPDIARNILLRGLNDVWRTAHGDGPFPYTSGGRAGHPRRSPGFEHRPTSEEQHDAYGEGITFLQDAVKDLPGFEGSTGNSLIKAFKRAIKSTDK